MGIEPTYPAWKAGVLPLNYTRMDAQNRNRTSDTRIFSPLLYQLSYLGKSLFCCMYVTTVVILHDCYAFVKKFFACFSMIPDFYFLRSTAAEKAGIKISISPLHTR